MYFRIKPITRLKVHDKTVAPLVGSGKFNDNFQHKKPLESDKKKHVEQTKKTRLLRYENILYQIGNIQIQLLRLVLNQFYETGYGGG